MDSRKRMNALSGEIDRELLAAGADHLAEVVMRTRDAAELEEFDSLQVAYMCNAREAILKVLRETTRQPALQPQESGGQILASGQQQQPALQPQEGGQILASGQQQQPALQPQEGGQILASGQHQQQQPALQPQEGGGQIAASGQQQQPALQPQERSGQIAANAHHQQQHTLQARDSFVTTIQRLRRELQRTPLP